MKGCLDTGDPKALYRQYVRELIIAGTCGNADNQRELGRRYDRYLSGIWWKLEAHSDDACRLAFRDALRAKRGERPQDKTGEWLAFPPWFREHVPDLGATWEGLGGFEPGGLALDPVCDMLVDPASALSLRGPGGVTHFFCCSACRSRYMGLAG